MLHLVGLGFNPQSCSILAPHGLHMQFNLSIFVSCRAEGFGGREQQLSEQRESIRHHQRPARAAPALLPPGEQLHGDEVGRAQGARVHRDYAPAAVPHGHLTQR